MGSMMLKQILDEVADLRQEIIGLADRIHENPELGYEECKAASLLTECLKTKGFMVKQPIAGMKTAFQATFKRGIGGPHVAFLAEYDALEELGHACGHNLIAGVAVAAAVALLPLDLGDHYSISVIGTPAGEGAVSQAGGKVKMIQEGIFKDLDLVLMAHPGPEHVVVLDFKAREALEFVFQCEPAHASQVKVEDGNALTGALFTFNAINALRQHLPPTTLIHGILPQRGQLMNTIPHHCAIHLYVKSTTAAALRQVLEEVKHCALGGALASNTTLTITTLAETYKELCFNRTLADLYASALDSLDIPYLYRQEGSFSSDLGNVSHEVPSLHPYFKIGGADVSFHTNSFAKAAYSREGHEGMLIAATALALTAAKVISSPHLLKEIHREHEQRGLADEC